MTRLAGFLMFSIVQASDIADGSTNHGFLSKYLQLRSESSKKFIGDKGKFMAHHLNRMEHGGRPVALSDNEKIADYMEDTDVQKLLSNESNKPLGFSATVVAVALLSLAAMVGVRMRRRMQPAVAVAGSSGHGIDMSKPLATVSADPAVFFVPAAAGNDRVTAPTRQNLFGGAPPEDEQPSPAAPPGQGGGKTMSVPGLGDITEEEMKLAMEFRNKMAQKMQETQVEGSALGGKIKVVYDGQGQPSKVEVTEAALGEGADQVAQGVVDAAKQAQAEALVKMKTIMQDMQKDIAMSLQADMKK
jgi:hypothetical protein